MTVVAQRRGACPTLSDPMLTGDGLLVRMNPVNRALTPGQLADIARAAARFGNGMIEVTARGNLQIRGLTTATAPLLASAVDAFGIVVRDGTPTDIAPLAGLDPEELADPRPLEETIRQQIERLGLSQRLGPKVSVVIDGGGRSMLDGVKADVRLTAQREGGSVVWHLTLGGDASDSVFVAALNEADAGAEALQQLSAIAALGKSGRARNLVRSQPMDASHSPAGRLPIGIAIPLSDSRVALRASLPFGAIEAMALAALADALEVAGVAELRFSPERSLLALCNSDQQLAAARAASADAGLIVDGADPRLAIVACAGAPACRSAHYATRQLAEAVSHKAAALLPDDVRLHLSGCEKRCAEPAGASISLIGHDGGCTVVANGTSVPSALRDYLAQESGFEALRQSRT